MIRTARGALRTSKASGTRGRFQSQSISSMVALAVLLTTCDFAAAGPGDEVLVVVGAHGAADYEQQFTEWAERWASVCHRSETALTTICVDRFESSRALPKSSETTLTQLEMLQSFFAQVAEKPPQSLWVVLIGHGTFDGATARFNLAGDDVTAEQLREWLNAIACQQALLNCTASSAPFINTLSGRSRSIVTATKSGSEQNFARFGEALSAVFLAGDIDLDKDGQMSLLESAIVASRKTEQWYRAENRLATEHALIDDNGDAKGTRLSIFDGVRINPAQLKGASPDGSLAGTMVLERSVTAPELSPEQHKRRRQLELKLEALRASRPTPRDDAYFMKLEAIAVELAKISNRVSDSSAGTQERTPTDAGSPEK